MGQGECVPPIAQKLCRTTDSPQSVAQQENTCEGHHVDYMKAFKSVPGRRASLIMGLFVLACLSLATAMLATARASDAILLDPRTGSDGSPVLLKSGERAVALPRSIPFPHPVPLSTGGSPPAAACCAQARTHLPRTGP